MDKLKDRAMQASASDFSSNQYVQVDSSVLQFHQVELLGRKLARSESKFDKIFILLDEVAEKVPDLSSYLLEIRREMETEIGALELEKREMDSKRKQLQTKADSLLEIECKNLETSVYLENRIQE